MLLPPSTSALGPPTRFALKARPVFVSLLAFQALLMIGRFIIMDLWGAMLTLLVVLMGSFVVSSSGGMDTTYCLYYGLMCLVNGIFDVILCVERWMHVKYTLFARNAPTMFNVASVVFLLCPAVEMASTVLAAYIYMDAQESEARFVLPHLSATQADVASISEEVEAATRGRPRPWRPDQGFRPFEGRSHHL
mmetsp:Transcript_111442/g.296139  ORF Transcript_111442/g.296139 Transcript_111442/m.296139 type:complete len:192 (-) Transcript_111442:91-666(-)